MSDETQPEPAASPPEDGETPPETPTQSPPSSPASSEAQADQAEPAPAPPEDSEDTEDSETRPETPTQTPASSPASPENPTDQADPAPSPPEDSEDTEDTETRSETPTQTPLPSPPRPAPPSPAALAAKLAASRPTVPTVTDHSESARFGRVADDGTVYVVGDGDGDEQAVGSYPGASAEEALQYFARKYDELYGMADLLEQRLSGPSELSAKDAAEQLAHLTEQMSEPAFVGDLAALRDKLGSVAVRIETRREEEAAARAAAKASAATEREVLVARAEAIAAQDPRKVQWKRSGEEMRGLFEEWKAQQRSGVRLDKPVEAELWQRFSAARTSFDKARRAHFSELESTQAEAKTTKERLVTEAEQLATSRDWGPTAREFKRLMDRWRAAGRAGRADDDALWARFKTAQDSFFTAKDEVAAAEDKEFRANLAVKEQLIAEAEALVPVTDLEAAKSALRSIQERWDKAGKVPRADMERTEKSLRRVEQAIRDLEDKKWSSSNPEARARAQSLVDQLERAVADLEQDLARAEATGAERKVAEARAALEARQGWLEQARAGLDEFS